MKKSKLSQSSLVQVEVYALGVKKMKSHANSNSRKDRRRLVIWHPTERVAYHYSNRYLLRNSFSKVMYLLMGFFVFLDSKHYFLIEIYLKLLPILFIAITAVIIPISWNHFLSFYWKKIRLLIAKKDLKVNMFFFYKRLFFLQVVFEQTIIPKSTLHFGMNKKKPFYVNPIKNVTQLSYNFGFT